MRLFGQTCHFTYTKWKFSTDGTLSGWIRGLAGVAREARTALGGFKRFRIHAESMKIMENGRNMTHIALLGLKVGQNECQRGCEFNGHLPDPLKPHKKFKMTNFGPTGERPKNHIKILCQTPDQPLKRPVCYPLSWDVFFRHDKFTSHEICETDRAGVSLHSCKLIRNP